MQRLRVPGGFLLAGALAWASAPTSASLAAGLPVSIAGLALRAWAAGHLAKNERLAISGPYACVRNPLYLGTLGAAGGLIVASRSVGLAALFATVFVLVYLPAIQLEEERLRELFPDYDEYARRVPALLPAWPRETSTVRFRIALYLKNQEYQALGGFVAGLLLLAWKAWR
ncbi:MAG: methyltransferase family protein [Bryobacteraceae bacterium]